MHQDHENKQAAHCERSGDIKEADGSGDIAGCGIPIPGTKAIMTKFLNLNFQGASHAAHGIAGVEAIAELALIPPYPVGIANVCVRKDRP